MAGLGVRRGRQIKFEWRRRLFLSSWVAGGSRTESLSLPTAASLQSRSSRGGVSGPLPTVCRSPDWHKETGLSFPAHLSSSVREFVRFKELGAPSCNAVGAPVPLLSLGFSFSVSGQQSFCAVFCANRDHSGHRPKRIWLAPFFPCCFFAAAASNPARPGNTGVLPVSARHSCARIMDHRTL